MVKNDLVSLSRAAAGELQELVRDGERGTVTRIERRLELYRGQLKQLHKKNRLDVGLLVAILAEIGMTPSEFFRRLEDRKAFGRLGPGVGEIGPTNLGKRLLEEL